MKLNATAGTSDQINASSFTFGGVLTVTNISGAFAVGESFQIFSGGTYSGSFSVINLPPLDGGLAWDTNNLTTGGALQVVSTAQSQPHIANIMSSGANLIFSGSNGTTGANYYVLTSTNTAMPLANWTRILTNTFDSQGNTVVTNPATGPQQFFLLQTQ